MIPAQILVSVLLSVVQLAVSYNPVEDTTSCCKCLDLLPDNVPDNVKPQVIPSPFKIVVSRQDYVPNEEVKINLTTVDDQAFRSFMIIAWSYDTNSQKLKPVAVGHFTAVDGTPVAKDCLSENGHALRSVDQSPKRLVKLVWTSPRFLGHVQFRATFIVDDDTFWAREKSINIIDPQAKPLVTPMPMPKVIDPINTASCGKTKGCYREPEGCWELHCEYIVTWQDLGTQIRWEIGGMTDGADDRYIAVGLSNDTYMGDDMVMECVHSSEFDQTRVYLSRNIGLSNHRLHESLIQKAIVDQEGSYYSGRLRCRFLMDKYPKDRYRRLSTLSGNVWHLLMARGHAEQGRIHRHGLEVRDFPLVSPGKISLQRNADVSGRASYPLVKAHACLMIMAWIFCASIGLLLTKYYKPMWPNKRFYDTRYWFLGHFNLMAFCFLLVVIAFILIFIEAGGYSNAPDLPQKAHPILGIIIFVCILINPIIALIRPSEDHKCRPVFNWFHWAFGTIANVLAIPTIFIGMDFGKPNVPWWATWILVIWFIFHLVIEISLEVHQCCTHKKNKERRKKYEMQRRENPKLHIPEPEPAGRRFKRFMLFLHVVVTSVITLIMVIIIAVS
ncbi:putative ferric-chelate reductase 1 [Gigantopelta aegis]|uniref:putative ferric-chelate reductase 1 n=1 Tax=Gigantopelta aegis TaxID=1735272 RepID=UPI001B888FE8|nr:putative ferric-chelate reductase 1 [Gigantopelta aegis]XP_041360086.1 putative ferric-chelate reductase 1 [Gigantopelta aegis]XP_041360087.1 putative ferric-chelate reductase 1 [Gigantopelta aegis]XP_041360088.1 putative ferric-chelate reductase 1 [Gigantopelta aegis]